MSATDRSAKRYMPGLDGLRAIAVLAVIFYHLNFQWAGGGFLGVVVFFVLSGYLITDLLLKEWRQTNQINLKKFWIRRIKRLLPGLLFMLIVVMAWITIIDPSLVEKSRSVFFASIFYVSNWWFIIHKVSYFESFGPPSPFNHLWSLAVEEQFYIIWPFVVLLVLSIFRKKMVLVWVTLIAGAVSVLLMVMLFHPGTDPSRVYYGTDTRIFSLLLGACLAILWPSQNLSSRLPKLHRFVLDICGTGAFVLLIWLIVNTSQYSTFVYQGGMLLTSVVSIVVIMSLSHPASFIGKLAGHKVLRWIGVRSYGIYLWQFPIITLTTPNTSDGFELIRSFLQIAAIIIIANFSWIYIEKPILNGALKNIKINMSFGKRTFITTPFFYRLLIGLIVLMTGISCFGLTSKAYLQKSGPEKNELYTWIPDSELNNQIQTPISVEPTENSDSINSTQPKPTNPLDANNLSQNQANHPTSTSKKNGLKQARSIVTVIGDSVMVDVGPILKNQLPNANINAKIGRQMSEGISIIHSLKIKGALGNIVVIELGTNGAFSQKQLQSLIREIGKSRKILLINTRVPRPWEKEVNSTLQKASASYSNVHLVNWYDKSKGRKDYFYPDGVHPNHKGSEAYANMILKAIKN
ncbi:acyltransferase family protein [Bacillus sp. FJAT-49736]|uniref:acyltransferase family protein n=1 Tax=Bacillus sp. FJAT-49736 TaxID=2833582 RepID=UPI001BC8CBA3|nr:acyltransferase family protein [Bacillus sp. FJAT-49736]MBS4175488.1 acetyltransferase [Bacillus sp. FJAT-49736]